MLALEASRRGNNRDWHHLLDLCAMTGTLLIDDQGMYDPRDINDRLVLGLQGTMSEFELSLFRWCARQAFEQKVGRGHAMWEIPVGFVRTDDDRVEKIADRRVQEAVAGVFRKFRELGGVARRCSGIATRMSSCRRRWPAHAGARSSGGCRPRVASARC